METTSQNIFTTAAHAQLLCCATKQTSTADTKKPKNGVLNEAAAHLLRVVQPRQEPDLARLLLADQACELRGPVPGVKAAHLGPRLPKHRVVRRYLPTQRRQLHLSVVSFCRACRWHGQFLLKLMWASYALLGARRPGPGAPPAGTHRDVAHHGQDVAAAHRVAGDGRDHRLWQPPDDHLRACGLCWSLYTH